MQPVSTRTSSPGCSVRSTSMPPAWMKAQPLGVPGRRAMPQFNLTDEEIREITDFLLWTNKIRTQDWPPNDAG